MIDDHKVLAVLCGRGGSKGLVRKNVLDLGGKPVIAWSVEAAANSALLDRCVVSTDDPEIADAARAAGGDVPFMRPAELATDTAAVTEAMIHVVENLPEKYDIIVLLHATSPFRTGGDIDACIRMLVETGADTCVTFSEMVKPPSYIIQIDDRHRMRPLEGSGLLKRRQETEKHYLPNAAVYAVWTPFLLEHRKVYSEDTAALVTPHERAIDIDGLLDLEIARGLLTRPGFPPK
ncbi:MAG: acylneuraminate cytidylyltransferase family protein [Minwuia sp.]|nr:acylneuraminate cytidylyltransferase family protein [Minwuia sp.]